MATSWHHRVQYNIDQTDTLSEAFSEYETRTNIERKEGYNSLVESQCTCSDGDIN